MKTRIGNESRLSVGRASHECAESMDEDVDIRLVRPGALAAQSPIGFLVLLELNRRGAGYVAF
jgi:hypothetical protein